MSPSGPSSAQRISWATRSRSVASFSVGTSAVPFGLPAGFTPAGYENRAMAAPK